MPRIALLSAEYPPTPGGIGDYSRQLGLALSAQHVDVVIVTGAATGAAPAAADLPIFRLPQASWGWHIAQDVAAALQQTRADLLHIQYQTGAYAMHPAINLLPRRIATPTVVTMHDLLVPYLFPKAGPLRQMANRQLMRHAAAVITTNAADHAHATGMLVPPIAIGANIAVAPPAGYDRAAFRQHLGLAPDTTLVAFFGLISRTKGVDTLIEALRRLPAEYRLVIIGGESRAPDDQQFIAAARARIQSTGLTSRVLITGHLSAELVSAYLLAADVAALPYNDGASFRRGSLLAALAHDLPTITTTPQDAGEGDEIAHAAVLVNPENPDALAVAIVRLAGDETTRARLVASGAALVAARSWQHIAARHRVVYEQVLRGEFMVK